jgi:pimeloyl-ACP methyl ester carboxylesterase
MLAYEVDGRGPSLLMIHGFGISFNIWSQLRPLLRDHFTLIMVELPGIGRSPVPAPGSTYLNSAAEGIEEVRLQLRIDSWRMLSYSSGTRVAERYLALHGDRVDRAAFICPAETGRLSAAALRTAIRLDSRYPQMGNWVLSGVRFRFLVELLGFNLIPNPLSPAWFEEITSQPIEILKETLRSMPGGGAAKFRLPPGISCLFIWGREDLITASPRRPSRIDQLIHARHSAPQTAAREVADLLLPFLG